MPLIQKDRGIVSLINLFRISPDQQQQFLELQLEQTRRFRVHMAGFISSTFHRSVDGTRLLNYAEWERAEDVAAARASSAFQGHLGRLDAFDYSNDMRLYNVVAAFGEGQPAAITASDEVLVTACMISVSKGYQGKACDSLVSRLRQTLAGGHPEDFKSTYIFKSLDGESLAIYVRWRRQAFKDRESGSALGKLGIDIAGIKALDIDDHSYEVVDTSFAAA